MTSTINTLETVLEEKELLASFRVDIKQEFGLNAAIFYNHFAFLQQYTHREDGYGFDTRKEIEEKTALGRTRQENARVKLEQAGLLETKIAKVGSSSISCLHYKVKEYSPEPEELRSKIKRLYYSVRIAKRYGIIPAIVLSYIEMISKKSLDSTEGIFRKTYKQLSELLGLSRDCIKRAIKTLRENSLIVTVTKFVKGLGRRITHFAALRICEKGVESLLKTAEFLTKKAQEKFCQNSRGENNISKGRNLQSVGNSKGQNLQSQGCKNNIPSYSSISPSKSYSTISISKENENGYKPEKSTEMLKTTKEECPVVNGYVDIGDEYSLKISSIGEFFTYVGRLPEPHEITW